MAQENKPKLTGYSRFKPMQEELLKLRVDVKELEERNKVLEDALTRARDWFYVHGKKDGEIYADGVKPSCIPYIEIALNKTNKYT